MLVQQTVVWSFLYCLVIEVINCHKERISTYCAVICVSSKAGSCDPAIQPIFTASLKNSLIN